jgi:hypothetical protein
MTNLGSKDGGPILKPTVMPRVAKAKSNPERMADAKHRDITKKRTPSSTLFVHARREEESACSADFSARK